MYRNVQEYKIVSKQRKIINNQLSLLSTTGISNRQKVFACSIVSCLCDVIVVHVFQSAQGWKLFVFRPITIRHFVPLN